MRGRKKQIFIIAIVAFIAMVVNIISPGVIAFGQSSTSLQNNSAVEITSVSFDNNDVRDGMIKTLNIQYKILDRTKLQAGDKITVQLPDIFKDITPKYPKEHFSSASVNNGLVTLIFNENVGSAVQGYINIEMTGDSNIEDKTYPVVIKLGNQTETLELNGQGRGTEGGSGTSPVMYKGSYLPMDYTGTGIISDRNEPIKYYVEINRDKIPELNNARFVDNIPKGMVLDVNSISIIKNDYYGISTDVTKDFFERGIAKATNNSLEINFGNIPYEQYSLTYNTLVISNEPSYVNNATLYHDNTESNSSSTAKLGSDAGALNVHKMVNKTNVTNNADDQNIEYQIKFDSYGTFIKGTMSITDTLDSRLADIKITSTNQFTTSYDKNTRVLTIINDKSNINPGDDAHITIEASMRNVQPGDTVTNVAYVNGNPTEEVSTKKNPKVNIIKIEKGDKTQTMLAGAVYSVQNSEGQSVKDVYGNIVGDITTLSTEPIILELPYGSYQLVEKKAPEGYKINNTPITFQVTENSKTVNVVAEDELVPTTGNLIIKKTDENGNLLDGAKFSLMQGDKVIVTGISQDGLVSFNNIKAGTYTIVENEAPKGYIVASDENVDIVAGETLNKTIVNNKIKGNIQITKVDSTDNNKKLQGAEFTVKSLDGKISETKETNGDGLVEFDNLPYGSYTYEETKAPEGYVLDTTKVNFEVTENGKLLTFTAEDDPIQGDIQINKVDSETGDELVGAKFEIRDSENNLVDTITTDKQGVATLSGLKYGDYTFQEVKAPIGYGIDSSKIPFTVSEHGKTLEFTAKNTKIKGGIKITKVDSETKKVLEGAIFNVKDSNGNVVGTQATGEDGIAEFNNLPFGEYTFEETKAPIGYQLNSTPVSFSIAENNKIVEFTANNNLIKGGIKITKVDSKTGDVLENATFQIKNSEGVVVGTQTTGKEGIVEFDNLPYGNYTYVETKAPKGYVLNPTAVKFSITENDKVLEFKAENNNIVGGIKILKIDSLNKNPLKGAEFMIETANGDLVETQTTGDNGAVEFNNLPYGDYTFREITAPIGYILDETPVKFSITENDKIIEFTAENNIIKGGIKITKYDSETNKILEGATFVVKDSSGNVVDTKITDENGVVEFNNLPYGTYTYEETKAPSGYLLNTNPVTFKISQNNEISSYRAYNNKDQCEVQITKVDLANANIKLEGAKFEVVNKLTNNVDGILVTNADGVASIKLVPGTYKLVEVDAPIGYIKSDIEKEFTIISGETTPINIQVANGKIHGGVKITKVDSETGAVLSGAEFEVKNGSGISMGIKTTDENGVVDFGDLPYGDYTFTEIKAPEGYLLDKTPVEFSILENGRVIEFTAKDDPIKGNMQITKVDSETGDNLAGAKFDIKDSIGKLVQTVTTDAQGIATISGLTYGDYTFQEVVAPTGYILSTEVVPFKVSEHGKTLEFTAKNTEIKGGIKITKVDSENNKVLEGATFQVKDSNGNVVNTQDTNELGIAEFNNLPYGDYTFVETKAPTGYQLDSTPVNFSIAKNNKILEFTAKNNIIKGGVNITKIDSETGNPLEGAEFTIKNSDGKVISTQSTNKDGLVEFNNLPYGDYTYEETKAPEGYLINSTKVNFSIVDNNKVLSFTAKNDLIKGDIQITKVDSETGNALAGAIFAIRDSQGDLMQTVTTDEQGVATVSGLAYGDYTYEEVKAPIGYILNSQGVPFELTEHGKTLEFTAKNAIIKGGIKIIKVDSENNKLLEGAEFVVKNSEGKVVDTQTTNKEGIVEFNNLPYGNYTYEETKAPKGYLLNNTPVKFEITDNEKILEFTAKNDMIKGGIKIVKVDSESNKVLEGAEFTIKDSIGNIVATGMTDKDGILEFDNLSYGNYTYEETKAPNGYTLDKTAIKFEVKEDNQKLEFTVKNTKAPGDKIIETPHTEDKSDDNITTLPKTGGLLSERVILILGIGLMILSLVLAVIVNKKIVK
ncbi:MSCRAMM family protein [Clostridium sp. B9]|uniref:MSCRAMM family protein n=1 Tax=Clostridium sp. B9 TaxID=3423224 RepID=UPI003D2EB416